MSERKMDVILPTENKREAEETAEILLREMDSKEQLELLNYMKAFKDGVNYARRCKDPHVEFKTA